MACAGLGLDLAGVAWVWCGLGLSGTRPGQGVGWPAYAWAAPDLGWYWLTWAIDSLCLWIWL